MIRILRERPLAEDFGKLAPHCPSQQIHLPETVTRSDVALREVKVLVIGCFDIRYAAFIATNRDAIAKAG